MTDVTADAPTEGGAPAAARDLKEDAKSIAASVQQRAQQTAEQVKRTVNEQAEVAKEWAVDQADVLRDTVQTKPFIAVGVSAASAFAAGLILGVLLMRR